MVIIGKQLSFLNHCTLRMMMLQGLTKLYSYIASENEQKKLVLFLASDFEFPFYSDLFMVICLKQSKGSFRY